MRAQVIPCRDDAECQELGAFLADRIYEFNATATGYFDGLLLAGCVRSETGEIIAGFNGHTWGGCCELSHVWVHERHRGQGLGTSLLRSAEAEALARGCVRIVLATHSFQAPGFYERMGYERKYAIEGRPKGHADIIYVKTLQPDAAPDTSLRGGTVMHSRLQNGDRFPTLSIHTVGGGEMLLPRDVEGSYSVILFYRGSWCPYCRAQLAAFARSRQSLRAIGTEVIALSVDDEATSAALVDQLRLNFPIGFGAKVDEIADATGAYVADGSAYLQSTGFVLDKSGRILTAVYSSGAIGRLVPDDVAGFVRYVESHQAATTPAEAGER